MFNDISNTLQRRLEHLGIDTESALGPDHAFKIEEKRIEPGDTVYLLGTARDNPDVDDTTGEENTDDLIIKDSPQHDLFLISNNDEDTIRNKATTSFWLPHRGYHSDNHSRRHSRTDHHIPMVSRKPAIPTQ